MSKERERILSDIMEERSRQDSLHPWTSLEEMPLILTEEFSEVIRAMQGDGILEDELLQVAAVCVRWLEMISKH